MVAFPVQTKVFRFKSFDELLSEKIIIKSKTKMCTYNDIMHNTVIDLELENLWNEEFNIIEIFSKTALSKKGGFDCIVKFINIENNPTRLANLAWIQQ